MRKPLLRYIEPRGYEHSHNKTQLLTLVLLDYTRFQADFRPNNVSLKWIIQFVGDDQLVK